MLKCAPQQLVCMFSNFLGKGKELMSDNNFVILNPYAGRWKAKKAWPKAQLALKQAGINYDYTQTEYPDHGISLAREAASSGYKTIIAAGGDGSISEVMNGIMSSGLDKENLPRLGILPLGSANDLAVNLKLPLDLPSAAQIIAYDQTRFMDLGRLEYTYIKNNIQTTQEHYFDNNSAIGLEPTITIIQQNIQSIHGTLRYMIAAILGILRNPQWNMKIEWDNGAYEGPATLVTVGNHPLTGGTFYMTPHADGFDGKLTFVFGAIPTRRKIFSVLPSTMKQGPGNYVERSEIHEVHTSWLRIHTDHFTPLHADGEILSENVQTIEYWACPQALEIFINNTKK